MLTFHNNRVLTYMKLLRIGLFFILFAWGGWLPSQAAVPDTVRMGCYLLSLHNLDFRDQEYTARFWVWMVYDKKLEDLENSLEVANAKEVFVDEVSTCL